MATRTPGDDLGYEAHRPERRLARRLVWLSFGASTAATLLALAGGVWWFAELFTHFRLYYLLVQGLLVLVFLNTHRPRWLLATLLLALPNAVSVGPYLLPALAGVLEAPRAAPPPGLVALNLNFRNPGDPRTIGYLAGSGAELLVLAEYTDAWARALDGPLAGYPHRVELPRETAFGLAVFSRVPFDATEVLDLGAPGSANARVSVVLDGRAVELFAVHLYSPTSPQRAAWRNTQLDALGARLAASPRPRLVVGDMNLTPFSPYFAALLRQSGGLIDARRPAGLHVTWPTGALPLWIPIDHCLADPSAGVESVTAGPNVGSDHYPVEIQFAAGG